MSPIPGLQTVGLLGSSLTQHALPAVRKPRCLLNPVATARCTAVTASSRSRGRFRAVAAGSVVVSGSLPSADGKYSLNCAVIVKKVDAQTRAKTSINELLRD